MLGVTGRVPVEGAQADVAVNLSSGFWGGGGARKPERYLDRLTGPEISERSMLHKPCFVKRDGLVT